MIRSRLHSLFKDYFEIAAFSTGLLLLAVMNPEAAQAPDLCLFEQLGITFCPGDGLGHSIAYTFRGEIGSALQSNLLGPFTILIIGGRIVHLISEKFKISTTNE